MLVMGLVFFGLNLFLWQTSEWRLDSGLLLYWGMALCAFGLMGGLGMGGLAYLQHYILRALLWGTRAMPWHYVRFLDYAAERILLRKVGGGYIFVHRQLLDYFASLDEPPPRSDVE
jgi:hypothetical protein